MSCSSAASVAASSGSSLTAASTRVRMRWGQGLELRGVEQEVNRVAEQVPIKQEAQVKVRALWEELMVVAVVATGIIVMMVIV